MSAISSGVLARARLRSEILVGGAAFWSRLKDDIASARERVWVQTLSFEGDAAGQALADAMSASIAADRRILVDSFTRVFVNDRLIHAPWNLLDRKLTREVHAGRSMIANARRAGVAIHFGGPLGFLLRQLPARDHKKIVVLDRDVAYIGGINFSEHNFAWHDLMLRIEASDVAHFLAEDFRASWVGVKSASRARFGPIELLSLNGSDNATVLESVLDRIRAARRSIYVPQPLPDVPVFRGLDRSSPARRVRHDPHARTQQPRFPPPAHHRSGAARGLRSAAATRYVASQSHAPR